MGACDSEVAILTPSTPLTGIMKKGTYSEPSSVRMNWMVFWSRKWSQLGFNATVGMPGCHLVPKTT